MIIIDVLLIASIWLIVGLGGMNYIVNRSDENIDLQTYYVLSLLGPVVWVVILYWYVRNRL
jgi:hypothetical protein